MSELTPCSEATELQRNPQTNLLQATVCLAATSFAEGLVLKLSEL